MSLLVWIILGLAVGIVASKLFNNAGDGYLRDIGLGVVGAVAGGWMTGTLWRDGATGLDLYSVLVSVVGAVILLVAYRTLLPPPLR